MRKEIITLIIVVLSFCLNAQDQQEKNNCSCHEMPELVDLIDCEPKLLDNSSKIYWNYSCDSSWLTFETAQGEQCILFSLNKEMIQYTTELGYDSFDEFDRTILVSNSPVSGCCYPPDYYIHDKNTGKLITYLGRAVFVSENKKMPFVVSLTDSKYGDNTTKKEYNSLSLYPLDNNKIVEFPLPKGEISKGMKKNDYLFPEELFQEPIVENNILKLVYFTGKKKTKMVKIDLNNYY